MPSLYDMLGINPTDGIDTDEVEAIKRALTRLQVEAAEVAKDNDSATTKALLDEMVRAIRKIARSGVASVDELRTHFAQSNDGSPARALGTSSDTDDTFQVTDEERLFIERMRTARPTTGQWNALSRVMNSEDLQHIEVDDRGTPKEITELAAELSAAKAKRDEAQRKEAALQAELATERDENKPTSLAGRLKAANSAALPTNVVDRAKLQTALQPLKPLESAKVSKLNTSNATVSMSADAIKSAYAKLQELAR